MLLVDQGKSAVYETANLEHIRIQYERGAWLIVAGTSLDTYPLACYTAEQDAKDELTRMITKIADGEKIYFATEDRRRKETKSEE